MRSVRTFDGNAEILKLTSAYIVGYELTVFHCIIWMDALRDIDYVSPVQFWQPLPSWSLSMRACNRAQSKKRPQAFDLENMLATDVRQKQAKKSDSKL